MQSKPKEGILLKAKSYVYRLLNYRIYSQREVEEKLRIRNFKTPIIKETLKYFKNLSLIDDKKFTKEWISSRLKKSFGLIRIQHELKNKGISDKIINERLASANKNYSEIETVNSLVEKQLLKHKSIDSLRAKQRVYSYLNRRGFKNETIYKAIKDI